MTDSFYVPERVMAIFAHPDDIEFGCAGTIARWVAAGAVGRYVLLTSGDVGIADPGMTKARAAEITRGGTDRGGQNRWRGGRCLSPRA